MPRGSGKFKTKRGGGRSFSRHLELDENGTAVAVDKWAARDKAIDEDGEEEDEEDEEEEEEEEESEEEGFSAVAASSTQPEMTRAERKALKKATSQKKASAGDEEEEDEDEDLVNPNHVSTTSKKISDLNSPQPMSRREREAKEKQEAKERYWKMHLEGKTDQAKADLARLAKIRKDREEAQAKRKAEAEAKQKEAQAKAAAQGRRR